jgi:hypothetical protein
VVVRVNQTGEHERAVQIDDHVGRPRRLADSLDTRAAHRDGPGEPAVGQDRTRVDEGDRRTAPNHGCLSRLARKTIATGTRGDTTR